MKILNADPAFGRPLTENQIHDFLSNSKLNIHIATIDEKGERIIHPTWYYFDATKNKIYIETANRSKKAENLNRCKGKVRIHEDVDHNIPIAEQIMVRYLGSLADPIAISVMDTVRDGSSVILEITPSFYSTWDETY
jgi:hypothetical protein